MAVIWQAYASTVRALQVQTGTQRPVGWPGIQATTPLDDGQPRHWIRNPEAQPQGSLRDVRAIIPDAGINVVAYKYSYTVARGTCHPTNTLELPPGSQ